MTWREWLTTEYNTDGWYIDQHYPEEGEPYGCVVTRERSTTYLRGYDAICIYGGQEVPVSADSQIVNGETYVDLSFGDI